MKNFILRYGIIGGCCMILLALVNWFFVARAVGNGISQFVGYLSIITSLLCVPMGIIYFRDKLNHGKITFLEGFKIGVGITFIASIIMFFYGVLFFLFEGENLKEWRAEGLTQSELEQLQVQMAQLPDFASTSWFQGIIMFIMIFLIGLFISLLSATLLKRSGRQTNVG